MSDSILAIPLDGSRAEILLNANSSESYPTVSANNASRLLLVQVHRVDSEGKVANHLRLFEPQTLQWHDFPDAPGPVGSGILAPDESAALFEVGGGSPGVMRSSLWLLHLRSNQTKQITELVDWQRDMSPRWAPSGESIAFLRLRRTPKGLISRLFVANLDTRLLSQPVGTDVSVSAVCYSSDGRRLFLLTATGVEAFSFANGSRSIIARWSEFQGRKYHGGGISWSKGLGAVALVLWNKNERRTEIWTLPLNDQAPSIFFKTQPDQDLRSLTIAEAD